jgi:hypothetical protein
MVLKGFKALKAKPSISSPSAIGLTVFFKALKKWM